MPRQVRVRSMATRDLELELLALALATRGTELDRVAAVELQEAAGDENLSPQSRAHLRRILRIRRELARRDYAFRPCGKTCTCQDCMTLLQAWTEHWRRPR